ncbi:MAG: hypothetical protein H8E37_02735 [Planctomycetes bacterium]|nr:hypothetical protein [Planctomycetota bacterium]
MTARRLTFQLTPLLDLLLIVIFAQFLDVQDKTENQEQTSSAHAENLESSRDRTSAELAALKTEHDRLLQQLKDKDDQLTQSDLATQKVAARALALEQQLERTRAEREAIASLYPKLFDLPDEVVQKLFSDGDRRLTEEDLERLRNQFKVFAEHSPSESARHMLTMDEMWKRCDVWRLHIRDSGLVVVEAGDRSHQFEAPTATDFAEELYDFSTRIPKKKSLVILLLTYGNIDADVYEGAVDGLPQAAERMRSESGGKSRFESAILGFNPTPATGNGSR